MNKPLIDYLLSKSGKLDENETWYDIAVKFDLEPANKKRAKKDPKYKKHAMTKLANDIWRRYVKKKNKLELSKETYKNGKLMFETFKEKPKPMPEVDSDSYEVEAFTTNPYGGAWMKMKKKENFFAEDHIEILREILTKEIEPVHIKKPLITNTKGCFVYGSDKHIGALTKINSVYKNKYDREEMKRRLVQLIMYDLERKKHLHGTFDSLFIMDLGDALDGFDGKTTRGLKGDSNHTLPQQLNNREQHDTYVELHRLLFDSIMHAELANNIYFVATSNSNHGGDFDYSAMRHLETYLNVKYPDINTFISVKPVDHFTYGKHAIIFGHGKDDEDMKAGFPLTLNDKVTNWLTDYIRVNKLNDYTISVISGDLHQSAETYAKNFRYKKVLSQYGSTKWMHSNFGSGSPGLSTEVFEKTTNRIFKTDEFFNIENEANTGIKF